MQTLTGYESYFKARFSSKYSMKPSIDGSYFIDRDGELFKYILEYFRTGTLILPPDWTKHKLRRFYLEIKYFAIQSLFDTALLKFFDSKIIRNNILKSEIIQGIVGHLNSPKIKIKIMESLHEWKKMFGYNILTKAKSSYT